jgi:hypothetical protein
MLIILQIFERSVISPKYSVTSLVSPKEEGVSIIYLIFNIFELTTEMKNNFTSFYLNH